MKTIIMFGDSITQQGNWQTVLGRTDVANCGLPGYTTELLCMAIKDIPHQYPDQKICFLQGGINDLYSGIPVNYIFGNHLRLLELVREKEIIPVMQSTLYVCNDREINTQVAELNQRLLQHCTEQNIEYLDLNTFLSKSGELMQRYSYDGLHLRPGAYIPWGKAVSAILEKLGL